MSTQRRMRLETVLSAITRLDEFSPQEAKQRCAEVSPQFVTQTLSQLAREGMLRRCDQDKQVRYRWSAAPESFQPTVWIDRQIHAQQVTQTPLEERPRERLLRDGASSLTTADLLAILIRVR